MFEDSPLSGSVAESTELLSLLPAHLRATARSRGGETKVPPRDVDAVVLAIMRVVGPVVARHPPVHLHRALVEVVRKRCRHGFTLQRLADCAVAYGVGWERVRSSHVGWGIWDGALSHLWLLGIDGVAQAMWWLQSRVPGFRSRISPEELVGELVAELIEPVTVYHLECGESLLLKREENCSEIHISDSPEPVVAFTTGRSVWSFEKALFVSPHRPGRGKLPRRSTVVIVSADDETRLELQRPPGAPGARPVIASLEPGAEVRLTAADSCDCEQFSCRCGTSRCRRAHRIASWEPILPLRGWVYSAVRGPTPIEMKGLASAMLGALLESEGVA